MQLDNGRLFVMEMRLIGQETCILHRGSGSPKLKISLFIQKTVQVALLTTLFLLLNALIRL